MNDKDLMPFGKHKGTPMANVPDSYLLWLYDRLKVQLETGRNLNDQEHKVLMYVEDFGVENLNP